MRAQLAGALLVLLALGACDRSKAAAPEQAPEASSGAALQRYPCVHFEALRQHLPKSLKGFERLRDEGSSGRYGEVSISEAERVFRDAEGTEISIRIVDTTLVDDLGRAIRAAASDARTRSEDDPTAPIVQHDTVGFVRYDQTQQRAEANLLVADRFVVAVTSVGAVGTGPVRSATTQIDLTGLALLR